MAGMSIAPITRRGRSVPADARRSNQHALVHVVVRIGIEKTGRRIDIGGVVVAQLHRVTAVAEGTST
jgi:hypothetical protein